MNRTKRIGLGLALGLLLALIGGTGLYLWQARLAGGYDVQGRVAGFSNHPRKIIIEHERIPGYMEAMTMPFTVKDSTALRGLKVGDAVGFHLNLAQDRSWITGLEQLPDSAVAKHPAGPTAPGYASNTAPRRPVLDEGDALPDVTLAHDQHGQPVHLPSSYEGQTLVLTFIYTRCPLPDYCPLMSQHFATLQDMIPAKLADEVELLSISFDPERDTPPVLSDYAQRYTDDLSNWTFATGTPEQVQRVTRLFGVFTKTKDGQIVHNLTTALVGPAGRVRKIWRGNDWQPQEVLQAAKRVTEATKASTSN